MVQKLRAYIGQTTMYQLVLRYLVGLTSLGILLSLTGQIAFSWQETLSTTGSAIILCYFSNQLFAKAFQVSTNTESWLISALIIGLIVGPGPLASMWLPILVAGSAAMASKFLLKWHNRHIFNPAAFGVVVMSLVTDTGASWWIGSMPLTLVVVAGGLAIVYKIRRLRTAALFLVSYLLLFFAFNGTKLDLSTNVELLKSLLLDSPLVFLATVMLVEPATSPTGRKLRDLYAVFVALTILVLQKYMPTVNYSTELGLVAGNGLTRLFERSGSLAMTLVRREKLSQTIESFFFETSPKINFRPGQFFEWNVPHPTPDSRGIRRWFTIASSPTEKYIQLTTRFSEKSSSFKTALQQLKKGEHIWAHGLEGDFVLPSDKTKALVFIAGGIGITPFRSMIKYLLDTGESRDITLLFAAKNQDDLIFLDLIKEAEAVFGLKFIPIISEPGKNWAGLSGQIDAQLLKQHVPELNQSEVFVSGPEPMVETLSQTLRDIGVPNSSIHQDFFPGYQANDVTKS